MGFYIVLNLIDLKKHFKKIIRKMFWGNIYLFFGGGGGDRVNSDYFL